MTTNLGFCRQLLSCAPFFCFAIFGCHQTTCFGQVGDAIGAIQPGIGPKELGPLNAVQLAWKAERAKQWDAADKLSKTNVDGAIQSMRQILKRDQREFGNDHPEVARTLRRFVDLLWFSVQSDLIPPLLDQELRILFQAYGKDDWRVRIAFCRGERTKQLIKAGQAMINRDEKAGELHVKARTLLSQNEYDAALTAINQSLEISRTIFKEDSIWIAYKLDTLSLILSAKVQYDEASQTAAKAAQNIKDWLGENSPDYSNLLVTQSDIARGHGRLALAEQYAIQALTAAENAPECPAANLAAAHTRLGRAFVAETAATKAISSFEKAIDLYRGEEGEAGLNVLYLNRDLAKCMMDASRLDEANELLARIEKVAREKYPKDSLLLMLVLDSRAFGLGKAEKWQESIDAYERVLVELKKLNLDRSPRAANTLQLQAQMERYLEHPEKASAKMNQSLDILLAMPESSQSDRRLAVIHATDIFEDLMDQQILAGDFAAAHATTQRRHKLSETVLGSNDFITIMARYRTELLNRVTKMDATAQKTFQDLMKQLNVANELLSKDEAAEAAKAVELFEKTIKGFEELLGPDLLIVADTRQLLAEAYLKMSQIDKAEAEYVRLEPLFLKLYGESNLPTTVARMFVQLADIAEQRESYQDALARARQAQRIYSSFGGDGTEVNTQCLERIGRLLVTTGEYEQAQSVYRELIEIMTRSIGKHGWRYAELLNSLGEAQAKNANHSEAEQSFLESLAVYRTLPIAGKSDVAVVLENLGDLYRLLNQNEQAIQFFQQTIEIATAAKQDRRLARSQAKLGAMYGAQQKYAEAESLLESAIVALEALGALGESEKLELERGRNDLELVYIKHAGEFERDEEFDKAIPLAAKLVEERKHRYPDGNYSVRDAMFKLAKVEKLAGLSPAQLDQYYEAKDSYYDAKANTNYQEALTEMQAAAASLKTLVGEKSSDYAKCLEVIPTLHFNLGDFPASIAALEQERALLVEMYGDSPYLAVSMRGSALMLQRVGRTADSIEMQRQIVAMYERLDKKMVMKGNLAQARSVLGEMLMNVGDLSGGGDLILNARSLLAPARVTFPEFYRDNLSHLVTLNFQTGNAQQALNYAQELSAAMREFAGDKSLQYAIALERLSKAQLNVGNRTEAEKIARDVLAISQAASPSGSALTSLATVDIANALRDQGNATAAEPLYQSAFQYFDANRFPWGTQLVHQEMAKLYLQSGNIAAAKEHVRPLEGQINYQTMLSYATSIKLYDGKMDEAAALAIQNIQLTEKVLQAGARFLNEQQQFKSMQAYRQSLDRLLSADPSGLPAAETYGQLLNWKGAIFARQNRLREAHATPEGSRLLEQWGAASGQLATLFLRPPYPHEAALWNERVNQFTLEKDRTELAISKLLKSTPVTPPTVEQVKASLPAKTALIDFLSYLRYQRGADGQFETVPCYVAFVVRPDREVIRVSFPNSLVIDQQINQWREALDWKKTPEAKEAEAKEQNEKLNELFNTALKKQDQASIVLDNLLWQPVSAYLDGVETVLISPDSSLAKFPFATLPGKKSGTYLIEDFAIAVIPVPQSIPELVDRKNKLQAIPQSLLLMGDVDYQAVARTSSKSKDSNLPRDAERGRFPFSFPPLAATGPEVHEIQTRFKQQFSQGSTLLLEKSTATEEAFRHDAPRHRWIHLSTHGFFSESIVEDVYSTVSSSDSPSLVKHHPLLTAPEGLMSGLAFAGVDDVNRSYEDDGVLCAMEVAASDLSNVELVVMSACQSGLGQTLSGEGVLGLQRAFQVAGAGSTISSLWPVSDQASRLLMNRFYRNLWAQKMTKLAALREAQLWMLNSARQQTKKPVTGSEATIDSSELPMNWQLPQFWAPFVLCGAWD